MEKINKISWINGHWLNTSLLIKIKKFLKTILTGLIYLKKYGDNWWLMN